jgi:tetratricopeptide (TPR) repeat protein
MKRPAVHRTIVVVDVAGFGSRQHIIDQLAVREGVYAVLQEAFSQSKLSWAGTYREDRGDGVLMLSAESESIFVDVLPYALAEALREHNRGRPAPQQLRLRLSVHAGEVVFDEEGVTGRPTTRAFRLLEAKPLRKALAASPGSLAMIVSWEIFDQVVRKSETVDQGRYRKVHVSQKETDTAAWIHLPDQPGIPSIPVSYADAVDGPPRQLPRTIRDFVGRDSYLTALDALLPEEGQAIPGASVIVTLDGTPGVGKTTLAEHWAHRVQPRFPDGTLFVNLRGYGPSEPLAPNLVLPYFLRALGVPDRSVPADLDAQTGLYRSLMADHRVLIVLDNAASPDQVRPLLPAAAGCMVLVTSRTYLKDLVVTESAHRIAVDPFTDGEAEALLRGTIGRALTAAEPDAVTNLIAACVGLPLALRVAAAHIADRRATVADVVESLVGDEYDVLRRVFDMSYSRLPPDHAHLFRRLGLHFGPRVNVQAAAVLAGVDIATASRHLGALADVHLVEPAGGGHYRMHDLLYFYAIRRANKDDTSGKRRRAVTDLVNWYGRAAQVADRLIFPKLGHVEVELDPIGTLPRLADRTQALRWMRAERTNLAAALRAALRHKVHRAAIALAGTARFLTLLERPLWVERLVAESCGLVAARASRNRPMEALLLGFRGDTNTDLGRLAEAETDFTALLALGRELDDPRPQRVALTGLGQVRLEQSLYPNARTYFQQALPLAAEVKDLRAQAVAHGNISRTNVLLKEHWTAFAHAEQELLLRRQAQDRVGEACALYHVATARQGLGEHDAAIELIDQAIEVYQGLDGTEQYIAIALQVAATSLESTGDLGRAKRCLTEACQIMTSHGDPQADLLQERIRHIEPDPRQ